MSDNLEKAKATIEEEEVRDAKKKVAAAEAKVTAAEAEVAVAKAKVTAAEAKVDARIAFLVENNSSLQNDEYLKELKGALAMAISERDKAIDLQKLAMDQVKEANLVVEKLRDYALKLAHPQSLAPPVVQLLQGDPFFARIGDSKMDATWVNFPEGGVYAKPSSAAGGAQEAMEVDSGFSAASSGDSSAAAQTQSKKADSVASSISGEVYEGEDQVLGSRFLRRHCYDLIWNKIWGNHRGSEMYFRYLITGTKGIGKSTFLLYWLIRMLQDKDRKHHTLVVLKDGFVHLYLPDKPSDNVKLIFGNYRVPLHRGYLGKFHYEAHRQFFDAIKSYRDESVMLLLDPSKEIGEHIDHGQGVKMLMFASANEKRFAAFVRNSSTNRLYMPLWTHEELGAVATENQVSEGLGERIDAFGLIPRYVAMLGKTHKKMVEEGNRRVGGAIGLFENKDYVATLNQPLDQIYSEVKSCIINIYVEDVNFENFTLVWATHAIHEKVVEKMKHVADEVQKLFLVTSGKISSLSSAQGIVFEKYCHKLIPEGGRFNIRVGDRPSSITISPLQVVETGRNDFANVSDWSPGQYIQPRTGNVAAIDALEIAAPDSNWSKLHNELNGIQSQGVSMSSSGAVSSSTSSHGYNTRSGGGRKRLRYDDVACADRTEVRTEFESGVGGVSIYDSLPVSETEARSIETMLAKVKGDGNHLPKMNSTFVLYQYTVGKKHPISFQGMSYWYTLLQRLTKEKNPRILFVFAVPPDQFVKFTEQKYTMWGRVVKCDAVGTFASVKQVILEIPYGNDPMGVASDTVAVAERVGAMTLSEAGAS